MLFKLHLPSRYTHHTWRIVIALIAGVAVTSYLQNIFARYANNNLATKLAILAIAITLLLYPTYEVQSRSYRLGYVNGDFPQLYQFLQQQPKDIVVASISKQGDFIPSLAKRSVLVSREYSSPYHWDFYQPLRQRTKALIKAQYSQNPAEINNFIQKYNVDFWLLDKNAFTAEYLTDNSWLGQFKITIKNAVSTLKKSEKPITGYFSNELLSRKNLNKYTSIPFETRTEHFDIVS